MCLGQLGLVRKLKRYVYATEDTLDQKDLGALDH